MCFLESPRSVSALEKERKKALYKQTKSKSLNLMEKIKADFIDRMNRQKAEERNKVRKKEKQTD